MVHKWETREESLSVPPAVEKDKSPIYFHSPGSHETPPNAAKVAAKPCSCPCQRQHTVVALERGEERAWGVEDIL